MKPKRAFARYETELLVPLSMWLATVKSIKLLMSNLPAGNFIYNAQFICPFDELNSYLHAEKENYDFI